MRKDDFKVSDGIRLNGIMMKRQELKRVGERSERSEGREGSEGSEGI
jgi:hypothetical protein